MNAPYHSSETNIRAALCHLDAHDRDNWVLMGMAVKSELGDAGFTVWDDWSQSAGNYQAKAAKGVWKSIKPAGRVTIASLFAEALRNGFQPDALYQPPSAEARARIEAERAEAIREAEAIEAAQQEAAKAKASKLWELGQPVRATHPYLVSKGITPTGAAQLRDILLIPLKVSRELVNLQIIGKDGSKRFLTGGQVKGASAVLGRLKGADTVLLCEGWATGCTLHQAMGLPVIVAFNAGNQPKIAERLATTLPASVEVIVCGDSDTSLTGQQAASKAAGLLYPRGRFVIPAFTPEQVDRHQQVHGKPPSDFNDLQQLAGLQAVRAKVSVPVNPVPGTHFDMSTYVLDEENGQKGIAGAAGNAELSENDWNHDNYWNQAPEPNNDKGFSDEERFQSGERDNGNHWNQLPENSLPYGFLLVRHGDRPGVYWLDPEGERPPRWVCSPLAVDAKTRDERGSNWGRLLSWQDAEGRAHRWAMPAELTCGDGADLAKELARGGLDIDPSRKARELLNAYLVRSSPGRLIRCTSSTGWHGSAFVLHDEVIGEADGEEVFLQTDRDESLGMVRAGTVDDWRQQVAALASGNSRLVFALSLAFAAPLADLANESGCFHIIGTSSAGKSTALEAAASVWGSPVDYGYKWRATSNGLEGLCSSRNDLLVILDELAQVDPREAGESAYLIANGQCKARASRNGTMRTPARWRVLLLSAGEISLGQHMQETGKQSRAGQEIRLIDIATPAPA